MGPKLTPVLENRLLTIVLIVLGFGSIVTAIIGVDAKWQVPLVFFALIFIIRILNPVEQIHEDVRYLRDATVAIPVRSFPSVEEFFADLRHAESQATHRLDLTHIRSTPPEDFGNNASGWYDEVLSWVDGADDRRARRIITIQNRRMFEWAARLQEDVVDRPRFEIRVLSWSNDAPAVNMAIVDEQAVFLAVTGDAAHRTTGIAVSDPDVGRYFRDYYDELFRKSRPLGEALAELREEFSTN